VPALEWQELHVVPEGSGMCFAVLIETTPEYWPVWQVEHGAVVLVWLNSAPWNEA
jgi:hypothetical protein